MPDGKNVNKLVKEYETLQHATIKKMERYNKVQFEIEQLGKLRLSHFEDPDVNYEETIKEVHDTISNNKLFKGKLFRKDKLGKEVKSYMKRLKKDKLEPGKADIEIDAMEKIKFVESNSIVDEIENNLWKMKNIENELIKSNTQLPKNDEISKWSPKRYELKSYTVVEKNANSEQVLKKTSQSKAEKEFMKMEEMIRKKSTGRRPTIKEDREVIRNSRRRNILKLKANDEIERYQHTKLESRIKSIPQQNKNRNEDMAIKDFDANKKFPHQKEDVKKDLTK